MKNIKIGFVLIIVIAILHTSCSPIAVRVKPTNNVVLRSQAPSSTHIWVSEEYVYRSGHYVVVPGYWSQPKRGRKIYKQGYWKHTRRGHIWISGRWL
jgi:hypothetical protein